MKISKLIILSIAVFAGIFLLYSCKTGMPDGAVPVKNFVAEKYLGKWYEIARFDFRFD